MQGLREMECGLGGVGRRGNGSRFLIEWDEEVRTCNASKSQELRGLQSRNSEEIAGCCDAK